MHACHAGNLPDLFDYINADINSLFLLIAGSGKTVYHLVSNIHPRHKLFHVACHAQGFGRSDTGKDAAVFIYSQITHHLHEFTELLYIIYNLGLDEICPCLYLLSKTRRPELKGISKGVGCAAQQEPWFRCLDILAALELSVIPHALYHGEKLDGVHVENTLCLRMIPELLMISSETEQIFYAKGGCSQDVCLDAYTIPVTARHLHHRLHTLG